MKTPSVSAHTDVNVSGIADGHVLSWSSTQGRFNVGAPAGGSLAIDDLTDVAVSSPQAGHTLVLHWYRLGYWTNSSISICSNC